MVVGEGAHKKTLDVQQKGLLNYQQFTVDN